MQSSRAYRIVLLFEFLQRGNEELNKWITANIIFY